MKELSLPNIKKLNLNENKLEKLSSVLLLLSMILIGSDRISINISGFTIRFVQLILIVESIVLIIQRKYRIVISIPIMSLIISHILSTIFSYDIKEGIAYNFWLVYNFIFVLYVFYSYSKNNSKEKVVNLLLISFAFQSIYIYIQFIIGMFGIDDPFFPMQNYFNIYRPAIWFYEPSYLATYFSVYLAISFYLATIIKSKRYILHTINALISLIFITSTTGYLAIAFTFIVIVFMNIKYIIKINKKIIITTIIVVILLLILVCFLDIHFINVFLGRIFRDGISKASGGRVDSWQTTFNVFIQHPILGIGPNAYPNYTQTGIPPHNVSLELLANLGIIGFLAFYYFFGEILYKAYKYSKKQNDFFGISIVLATIIFMVVLQANQNYMRIYLWMLLGISLGFTKNKNI